MECLEERQLLASGDALTGDLHYDAEPGEVNETVLSPGHFFSIQDVSDVALTGAGGCVVSDYLRGIGVSVDISVGGSVGIGTEYSWGVGFGIGVPLIPMGLPDGLICPSPEKLTTSPGITDAMQQTFSTTTRGASSAVAGANVTQAGAVYYQVKASSATVDEYRLYQTVVDPATATHETEGNDQFATANVIAANSLVVGDFTAGAKEADFYKFSANTGDRLALILDNDPDRDGQFSNTRITLYGPDGKELAGNVSFSDGSATKAITVDPAKGVFPGTFYVSVADNGYGKDEDYRFVVVKTQSGINEDTPKTRVFNFDGGALGLAIPDNDPAGAVATLPVDVGAPFAKADAMEVTLNIDHASDSQLAVTLESPTGTMVDLVLHRGGAGQNFTGTVLNDAAPIPISLGSAPFTGSFRPEQPLSGFANDLANGNWKLHVVDTGVGSTGTVRSWSLKFNVRTNETASDADPLATGQYAKGAVSSEFDRDWFKVTSASIQPGQLVFAFVDTEDTDGVAHEKNDSYLTVLAADATTVLGEDDDDGPMISGKNFDAFKKDLKNAGVDIDAGTTFGGDLVVSVADGNDRVDASKINLVGQKIEINGGTGDDMILGPGGDTVFLNGNDGNDTFVFNNTAHATVTLDGGDGNDGLAINGTAGNDMIAIKLEGPDLLVSVNGIVATYKNIAASSIEALNIAAGDGDDTILVDISGGLMTFSQGIGVGGEGGQDRLTLYGTAAPDSNQWIFGSVPGVGTNTITAGGQTQVVEFEGFDPVLTIGEDDQVPGPLEVIVPASDNAVTLSGGTGASSALLSVDNLASLQFAGKTAVTIDAGAGSDSVYLAQAAKKGFQPGTVNLTILGNDGDDAITAEPGLENAIALTLDGGAGSDHLQADAILLGGPGDDTLVGGPGNDTFVAGAGNDTIVLGGGADSVDGGADFDTILVSGTPNNDSISVRQTGATSLEINLNGSLLTPTIQALEAVDLEAGAGQDVLAISVVDSLVATPSASLKFIVGGNDPEVADRLTVWDDGLGDMTILRQSADGHSGSVTVGLLTPIVYQGIERVDLAPVNSVTDGYGGDGQGRLLVLQADPFEDNDSRRVATELTDVARTEVDPSIDPVAQADPLGSVPSDEDWYRYAAPHTGTVAFVLQFQAIGTLTNGRAGLPGDGLLKVDVYDAAGTLIAKANESDASHTIGVEGGAVYYVRVQGATAGAVNRYDLTAVPVDLSGPQVTGVSITGSPTYNIFNHKKANAEALVPTPLVHSLTIDLQDYVVRRPGFIYPALDPVTAGNVGNYLLVGDAEGVIPIAAVEVLNATAAQGSKATAQIRLIFDPALVTPGAEPFTLPDDRFTLTISDGVFDPAGNRLDGESNADEPHAYPRFPSGDTVAGGSFVARFTVDSRPEIGVWDSGSVYLDTNGNMIFDPTNLDATNRDTTYVLGFTSDHVLAGNFTAAAGDTADGFQKLAAYGNDGSGFRWLIDTDNDGAPNLVVNDLAAIVGSPVAANFDGNAVNGDEVGLFDGTTWYLDGNHDYQVTRSSADARIASAISGLPLAGDFDGDGLFDLATWNDDKFYFDLGANGFGRLDAVIDGVSSFGFLGARTVPVSADMDQDGITDVGLWVPDRSGADPQEVGEWYFLVSNDPTGARRIAGSVTTLAHTFTPVPFGKDLFGRLGNEYAMPVVGNFDPPLPENYTTDPPLAGFTVTPTAGLVTTEAGAAAAFTIRLNSQPTANVTIGLSPSDTTEGTASVASVVFTPADWSTPQTVTLTGVDDLLADGNVGYALVTAAALSTDPAYDGLNPDDVLLVNNDNDAAGFTVTPTSGLVTTEAGVTATFTITLHSQPTANVSIALLPTDPTEGTLSAASVMFTPADWSTPQTVTVTGVDDSELDAEVAYTIVLSPANSADPAYNNLDPADVSVANLDNENPCPIVVTPISGLTTTESGGKATFTIVLRNAPTAKVTVRLSSNDTSEGRVSPSRVVFKTDNWSTPQTITVTGANDRSVDGDLAYTIVTAAATSRDTAYNGLDADDIALTNLDNDAPAKSGLYDPATSRFYLESADSPAAAVEFGFGVPGAGWKPIAGDWNGDGQAGVGLYDPSASVFYLTDTLQTGCAQYTFAFGEAGAGWLPVAGDWDGDGRMGVGLYDPRTSTFYLTDALSGGYAQYTFGYGQAGAGWLPVAGDWTACGRDTIGLYDPLQSIFHLRNSNTTGFADLTAAYGLAGGQWQPVVGNWSGSGADTIGLYAPSDSFFHLRSSNDTGMADIGLGFGQPGDHWMPIAGVWVVPANKPSLDVVALHPQAVDQIDLATVVEQELDGVAGLDDLLDTDL